MSTYPEIAFYHLTQLQIEEALPPLLAKTLDLGERAVVRAPSDDVALMLDKKLWMYEAAAFWLPHATSKSLGRHGRSEDQPIWISGPSAPLETPNKATFLFRVDGGSVDEDLTPYNRIFDLFNGNDEACLNAARGRWKQLRDENRFVLTYWHQKNAKGWSKERTHLPSEPV